MGAASTAKTLTQRTITGPRFLDFCAIFCHKEDDMRRPLTIMEMTERHEVRKAKRRRYDQRVRTAKWEQRIMNSVTAADLKLGGRLLTAADAMGAGHLSRAAGIFNEIADDLNIEATEAALLSEETEAPVAKPEPAAPQLVTAQPAGGTAMDLQMCSRNVHSFGAPDSNGWRTCAVCGNVNVAPPDNNGPIDMSQRQ